MSRFIDRSNANGPANVDHLAAAGVSHIYLKASEGATFTDETYVPRKIAAAAAGATFGAYHFGRPDTGSSPYVEARHFLFCIGEPEPGRLRPALDLEEHACPPLTTQRWAEDFVNAVHGALGYYPVLYGSTGLIAALRRDSSLLRRCAWWRAEYGPVDNGTWHPLEGGRQGAAIHQYTSRARFGGIAGYTDANLLLALGGVLVPGKIKPAIGAAWRWAQWYLGVGQYKGHGHYAHEHHVPDSNPPPLPPNLAKEAWACVRWYTNHGVGA